MLGYLLARAGVDVVVLEKHADFFRDFRGDTVHPSTLEVMYELGLLEDFLKLPHQKVTSAGARVGDFALKAADFSHLPTHCKFIALMPQWDFLNFLADRARRFSGFHLRMQTEAVHLLRDGARIVGVEGRSPEGPVHIQADLVVGCDGRHSTIRQAAGLEVQEFGVPIDVLWFRLSRRAGDPEQVLGNVNYGKVLILINRGDYFQAGLIIRKGSFEETKREGLDMLREAIARIAPYLGDRARELESWDQIKLLTVQINRLRQWHLPGLLCIGDAAHAMSLAGALQARAVTEALLAQVQRRREFPTRVTQMLQVNAHKAFANVFETSGAFRVPWQLKAVAHVPGIQRVMGHVVGMGVRPEHVTGAARTERSQPWSLKKAAVSAGAFLGAMVATVRALRAA